MEHLQEKPQGAERRKRPHINIVIACNVALEGKGEEQTYFTKNISAGGLCILVTQKVEVNTIIPLRIKIPSEESHILTKGKVVWSNKFELGMKGGDRFHIGIEFTEISASDRKRIHDYIAEYIER